MSAGWEDLVARVAGASTLLLGRPRLLAMTQVKDLPRLATELETAYGSSFQAQPGMTPDQLELAVRRVGAGHLRTLARWSARRAKMLWPLFLDEDRRNVRALLRGAAAGTSSAERQMTLVPTPGLPTGALEELARQESIAGVVGLLLAWGHPFGAELLPLAREAQPDLLRLDAALNFAYVSLAADAARHARRPDSTRSALLDFVADTADSENASTALQLAGQRSTLSHEALFVEHGACLNLNTFLAIAASPDVPTARSALVRALNESRLARVFEQHPALSFEDAVLATRLRTAMRRSLLAPLGAASVLSFFLRIRAEVRDLSLIIWRLAAGAPALPPAMLVTVQ